MQITSFSSAQIISNHLFIHHFLLLNYLQCTFLYLHSKVHSICHQFWLLRPRVGGELNLFWLEINRKIFSSQNMRFSFKFLKREKNALFNKIWVTKRLKSKNEWKSSRFPLEAGDWMKEIPFLVIERTKFLFPSWKLKKLLAMLCFVNKILTLDSWMFSKVDTIAIIIFTLTLIFFHHFQNKYFQIDLGQLNV